MEDGKNLIGRRRASGLVWGASPESASPQPMGSQSFLTWEQALRILEKRKRTLLAVVAGVTVMTAAVAFLMRDVYQPMARLEIDPLGGGIKTLHEIEGATGEGDQDYLDTQIQILQSDGLAMRVIRSLHLDMNAEIIKDKDSNTRGARTGTTESPGTGGQQGPGYFQEQLELAEPTVAEASALRAFHGKLSVNPIRGSRLVELSFASHNPRTAQMVTNSLVTQFIDQNYKNRYATTMEASEWLSAQLNDLRQEVSESNEKVSAYQKKYGLLDSDGRDLPQSQLMTDVSRQLSEAQADRIQTEAYVRMIDMGQAESIPALRDDVVYQGLLGHFAEVRGQLAQAETVYGDENVNVKKLQNQANELAAQLDAQRGRIINRVRTSFAAARSREQMMLSASEQLRGQMSDTSSHLAEYRTLKTEADASANLYNTLQARLREAGIYAGLRSGNIRVVDMAPRLHQPTGPHRGLIIATGFIFSSLIGLALVFVQESFQNTVRIPDDIQEWVQLPSLAILPKIAEGPSEQRKLLPEGRADTMLALGPKVFWFQPQTAEAEAIRSLRAALGGFSDTQAPQVILITSAVGGEGKSTVAINLASVLAQHGRTCLLEADLRRPTMTSALKLTVRAGLGEVLEGKANLQEAMCTPDSTPGMTVLPAKSLHQNPSDLLSCDQMKNLVKSLRESFVFVVIDSPPIIPFSDAQSLARLSDAIILVSRYGQTTRRAITRGAELIEEASERLMGVVLNDMDLTSPDYRYFAYGYSWNGGDRRYPYAKRQANWNSKPDEPDTGPGKAKGAHA